jgi:hypothetical protein
MSLIVPKIGDQYSKSSGGQAMKNRNYTNAELGLLAGILVGTLIGIYLFTLNGHILYISLCGLGAVIGLGIGTGLDITHNSQN